MTEEQSKLYTKTLIVLGLLVSAIITLGIVACTDEDVTDDYKISEDLDVRDYRYLDEVLITKGFYKDYKCLVLSETHFKIKCQVEQYEPLGITLNKDFSPKITIRKALIQKVEEKK